MAYTEIFTTIVLTAFSIIGFFFARWIRNVDIKQENQDKEIKEMKFNYIERFDIVNKNLYSMKTEILNELAILRIQLSNDFVKKTDCEKIHKHREE